MGSKRKETRRLESIKKYYIIKDDRIKSDDSSEEYDYTTPKEIINELSNVAFNSFDNAFENLSGVMREDINRFSNVLDNPENESDVIIAKKMQTYIQPLLDKITERQNFADFILTECMFNDDYVSYSIIPCDSSKS